MPTPDELYACEMRYRLILEAAERGDAEALKKLSGAAKEFIEMAWRFWPTAPLPLGGGAME